MYNSSSAYLSNQSVHRVPVGLMNPTFEVGYDHRNHIWNTELGRPMDLDQSQRKWLCEVSEVPLVATHSSVPPTNPGKIASPAPSFLVSESPSSHPASKKDRDPTGDDDEFTWYIYIYMETPIWRCSWTNPLSYACVNGKKGKHIYKIHEWFQIPCLIAWEWSWKSSWWVLSCSFDPRKYKLPTGLSEDFLSHGVCPDMDGS